VDYDNGRLNQSERAFGAIHMSLASEIMFTEPRVLEPCQEPILNNGVPEIQQLQNQPTEVAGPESSPKPVSLPFEDTKMYPPKPDKAQDMKPMVPAVDVPDLETIKTRLKKGIPSTSHIDPDDIAPLIKDAAITKQDADDLIGAAINLTNGWDKLDLSIQSNIITKSMILAFTQIPSISDDPEFMRRIIRSWKKITILMTTKYDFIEDLSDYADRTFMLRVENTYTHKLIYQKLLEAQKSGDKTNLKNLERYVEQYAKIMETDKGNLQFDASRIKNYETRAACLERLLNQGVTGLSKQIYWKLLNGLQAWDDEHVQPAVNYVANQLGRQYDKILDKDKEIYTELAGIQKELDDGPWDTQRMGGEKTKQELVAATLWQWKWQRRI
jgi:hypothetical protein